MTKLPGATFNEEVIVTDSTNIENGEFSISWKGYEDAANYLVKVFFNINYMDKRQLSIVVYETLYVFTYPKPEVEESDKPSVQGFSDNMILIIAASVVGLLSLLQ